MQNPMHLFPDEDETKALARRIKMHEFLIPGGVQLGYDSDLKMQYSEAIEVSETPDCPWHGADCLAWIEIREGRGSGQPEAAITIRDYRSVHHREVERTATGEHLSGFKTKVSDAFQPFGGESAGTKTPRVEDARNVAEREMGGLIENVDEIEIEGSEEGE
jgi:hypothetical protein